MKFDAPKGRRIHHGFLGVSVKGHMYFYPQKKWLPIGSDPEGWEYASSNMTCRTLKAFRRFLRKNPQFKGKCWLESRWVGHDIRG